MRRLRLAVEQIGDKAVREAFQRIYDELALCPFLGFRGRHVSIARVPGTYTLPHRLGFRPKDVVETCVLNGTVSWDYDEFTTTDMVFTLTGTAGELTTVRAFIGIYTED